MRRRNIIAALVLIVFGLVYGLLTAGLPERSLPNTPGPPFFPWIMTVLVLVLSAALLIQALIGGGDSALAVSRPTTGDARSVHRAALALAAFVVYLAGLPAAGFIVATVPFFAVLMLLFGERRWWVVALGTVVATATLYVLFRHIFGVFLPPGLLRDIVP